MRALADSGEYSALIGADLRDPHRPVPGVRYERVDIRCEIPREFCPDVTEIYNLAAVHVTPGHEDWEYYWTNVMGATNVCEYATRNDVRFIAFTSSISVYGPCEDAKDEVSVLEPDSAYGRSKLAAERIHSLWQSEHSEDRKLVIVRPAVIYGLGERGNFTRLSRLLRRGLFFYPGRKDTIKACGYVEDLVASLLWARERPEQVLLYNFCHPERYTAEQICASFAKVANYRSVSPVIPFSLMLTGALPFEALSAIGIRTSVNRARVTKLNRSTNIVPARLQHLGFPYRFALEDGLRRWHDASTVTDFD